MENRTMIIALGSNFNQETNIEKAVAMLTKIFKGNIIFSAKLWTEPLDIESDRFLNCIVKVHTEHDLYWVQERTKAIEKACGRTKADKSKNIVKMDIDILKYGDEILREKDMSRTYITELLKEYDVQ